MARNTLIIDSQSIEDESCLNGDFYLICYFFTIFCLVGVLNIRRECGPFFCLIIPKYTMEPHHTPVE